MSDLWEQDILRRERQEKWDRRWLIKAMEMASFSKDPSTKVGAIIVNSRNQVVGTGYNGFPRGVQDTEERLFNRELKYKLVCHAEQNAIWVAGERAIGSTMYVWPCFTESINCHECAKAIIQSGIIRTVGFKPVREELELSHRWRDSIDIAKLMFEEAGVIRTEVNP